MADEENQESQEQKGGKGMLFVIIGAVLLLIIVGIVTIVLLSGGDKHEEEDASGAAPQAKSAKKAQAPTNTDLASVSKTIPIVFNPPLVVNLASQGRESYYTATISVAPNTDKLEPEIERKMDIIKDRIVSILSTKTADELRSVKGLDRTKEEITNSINEFLIDGQITHTFITSWAIQTN